ncbi:MAG: glycosyl hydrolase [Bacillota bacterium]|nr:glycosyl hydrolase [Bacillota bacterium]
MNKKVLRSVAIILSLVIIFISSVNVGKVNAATSTRKIYEGAWLGTWPNKQNADIENYTQLTGRPLGVVHTFVNTNQNFSVWTPFMDYVNSSNGINLLTIETLKPDNTQYNTVEINNGALDSYFTTLANDMKAWQNGQTIWVRIMHEVNGNWYGWSIGDSTVNTNQTYINAYRRIVNIFRKNGAKNVKFIYNINCDNVGQNASYMGAYPGDYYVDYVSIDGYNWGTSQSWSTWRSFDNIFKVPYQALCSGTTKPVILAEYASSELGGDKASWIQDAGAKIKSSTYSRIYAAVWFNQNKETDWRINSSTSSLKAYQSLSFK